MIASTSPQYPPASIAWPRARKLSKVASENAPRSI
jgi:hypothetical protein